jgi:NADH dehydrogenase
MDRRKKILIVGGGFGGVKAAQLLGHDKRFQVKLIDPKSFMEYHAATYRMTTGGSATEVCIPYTDLLKGVSVEVVKDAIVTIDIERCEARGASGSTYAYDELILAIGCEASYFGIEGVAENAFNMNDVSEALKLRAHIHACFEEAKSLQASEQVPLLHIAIIGGGPSGVELAGALAAYTKYLSKKHAVDASLVSIDLIEAMQRLLPGLPATLSEKALQRLRTLGVNVYLHRSVMKEGLNTLFLKDMQMTVKTVVWTAGLKGHRLAASIIGLSLDKRGRILVDDKLHAIGAKHVFAIGDIASTKYAGMAQTALADAAYTASLLQSKASGRIAHSAYSQPAPSYAVPVGPGFAVVLYHGLQFSGRVGWFLRRAADARAFLAMLRPLEAFRTFMSGYSSSENCSVCTKK